MFSLSLTFSICIFAASAASSTAPKPNPHLVAYPSFLNVLPEPFERPTFLTNLFYQTTLPSNAPPQFAAAYETLLNASFISFDPRFVTDVVGSAGPVEKVAVIEDGSQEMPIYLKDEGVILWSGNDLAQFRTINVKTYEVKNYTTSVPVPNTPAGTIHKGQIYLGNFGDTSVHGGIWLLDYKTGNATMILNNQLGLSIGADDMSVEYEYDMNIFRYAVLHANFLELCVVQAPSPNIYGDWLRSLERGGLDASGGDDTVCRDAETGTFRDCQRAGRRHVRLRRGASLPMMFLRAVW
ncbi:hypothetical protein DFH06DRAFT_1148261 [Mycena polygramma]|nr:hypothetical protein DFH06DRAFT_1148261 [Mycena polygramma]